MGDWLLTMGLAAIALSVPLAIALVVKLYVKCTLGRCTSLKRLDSKTVIITGSNSGIGKKTAQMLAARGAKVIMACRNVLKAEQAAEKIRSCSPGCDIVVEKLDLCSLASIRQFAEKILQQEQKIDILVNNAGIAGNEFKLTEDGFEEIYQANYLGPVYLTELLMCLLKKSPQARIINTGSSGYFLGNINIRTFSTDVKTRSGLSMSRYGDSKLAMLMWTKAMADELKDTGITINYVHPGVVNTAIANHHLNFSNLLLRLNIIFCGRSAEEGAQTLLHLCLEPIGSEISGEYWSECKPTWIVKGKNKAENHALLGVTRECLGLSNQH